MNHPGASIMAVTSWTPWQCSWYSNLCLPPNAPVTSGLTEHWFLTDGIIIIPWHAIPTTIMWRNASMELSTACHIDSCTYICGYCWLLTLGLLLPFRLMDLHRQLRFHLLGEPRGKHNLWHILTHRSRTALTDFCACTEDVHFQESCRESMHMSPGCYLHWLLTLHFIYLYYIYLYYIAFPWCNPWLSPDVTHDFLLAKIPGICSPPSPWGSLLRSRLQGVLASSLCELELRHFLSQETNIAPLSVMLL